MKALSFPSMTREIQLDILRSIKPLLDPRFPSTLYFVSPSLCHNVALCSKEKDKKKTKKTVCWRGSSKAAKIMFRALEEDWGREGRGEDIWVQLVTPYPSCWISKRQKDVVEWDCPFCSWIDESSPKSTALNPSDISQIDTHPQQHTHPQPCYFGNYTLWSKWWLSALIVFAGDWCPERSFLTADWERARKR